MKSLKLIVFLLVLIFAFNFSVDNTKASSSISIYINGEKKLYSSQALIKNGTTLVPLRSIFEDLGAKVNWDQKNNTIDASKGQIKVSLKIGSKTAKVNGKKITISISPQVKNGITLVPLRFISESLGENVQWHDQQQVIIIGEEKIEDLKGLASCDNNSKKVVKIPDRNLERLIKYELNITKGSITVGNMCELLMLSYDGIGKLPIKDLTGLEYAKNLFFIYLYDGQINSLEPLRGLTELDWISLDYYQISDISPLSGLTKLTYLNIAKNKIKDISTISKLPNLEHINLGGNPFNDLSPLSELKNLKTVSLDYDTKNQLSEENLKVIEELKAKGIYVVFSEY